LAKSLERKTKE